jgi:hypothetical protein
MQLDYSVKSLTYASSPNIIPKKYIPFVSLRYVVAHHLYVDPTTDFGSDYRYTFEI